MTTAREILLDPIVRDRRVLELWPGNPEGDLRLSAQVASEWSVLAPDAPPLPIAEGDIDVLLALSPWWVDGEPERRVSWLAEIDRVLSGQGALILDLGPRGEPGNGIPGLAGPPSAAGQEEVVATLRQRLGWVVEVSEVSFLGAGFLVADLEDIALAGDLAALASAPARRLVIAARQAHPDWQLRESLLIPLPDPGQARRLRALTLEVDELRDQLMATREQNEQLQQALVGLRRDSERHLGLLARSESATELSILERDRARRRAEAAERAQTEAEVALRRRSMEVAALERELTATGAGGNSRGDSRSDRRQLPTATRPPARTLDLPPLVLYVLPSARSWRNW